MTLIHLLSFKNRIKLEISNSRKIPNTWRLNKTLLYNTWVKEKKKNSKEVKLYFEVNENKNIIYQNLWNLEKSQP